MVDLKMWHEEGNVFHSQMSIFFSQANRNKILSLSEVLRITSDAAVEDYRQQGLSREILAQNGYAILVSRLHRQPRENERIEVVTWEEKPELLQLRRAYEIKSMDGERLVSGMSTWLVVNPETRRIIPTKDFTMHTPPETETQMDCMKPGKISVPKEMSVIDERKVKFSDIDANGHTTNSRYGAFVADALPAEYRDRELVDFRLNYSKEALLDEKLTVFGNFDDNLKKACIVGKTESGTSFESELFFK